MRIGIFFGGQSREREISFAGGRTVFDNLDKTLFTPVPIFVDSFGNFIQLDWQYIYKGSIRDFYPHVSFLPKGDFSDIQIYAESLQHLSAAEHQALISTIGTKIPLDELSKHIDFAFLCLHGVKGEDGTLQGLLEFLQIPYSGAGVLASALGMNKVFQKQMLQGKHQFASTRIFAITRHQWQHQNRHELFGEAQKTVGIPWVSRPSQQGSSIGVGILNEDNFEHFEQQINQAFFIETLSKTDWQATSFSEQKKWLRQLTDIRSGIGLPLLLAKKIINTPQELFVAIEHYFEENDTSLKLQATDGENEVLIEEFIDGREFSCIVLRTESGEAIALPPTEIVKGDEIFDYRSKYLPGLSRKITPIDLPNHQITEIGKACEQLFSLFRFEVYARIDGFIQADGKIILNDPNTTSGMLPSSFFFHQAAEIGLNPSQFLNYIIRCSLMERSQHPSQGHLVLPLLNELDSKLAGKKGNQLNRKKIGVVLGGYSSERHISVESGRNIFEKLASSSKYQPVPLFLSGNENSFELHELPINVLLKDNADDILQKIKAPNKTHPFVHDLRTEQSDFIQKYTFGIAPIFIPQKRNLAELAEMLDFVFIALHGRPGEDGALQLQLEQFNVPYNGSGVQSSQTTIDKFKTNQFLAKNGISVAQQLLVQKTDFEANATSFLEKIETNFDYPLIAKPSDDGCSSAVKLIHNRAEMAAYSLLLFRNEEKLNAQAAATLHILPKEEIPRKQYFLLENFIEAENAAHFLEVTAGLLTHHTDSGAIRYEMFEPSEALSSTAILSLEEKFLAGEGQNITPARFSDDEKEQARISKEVRKTLEKVATLLQVQGYARIDAFVRIFEDEKVETIIVEINSLPGMTPATCIFHQTALNGYQPFDFIDKIIEFGIGKSTEILA